MLSRMSSLSALVELVRNVLDVFIDALSFFRLTLRSPSALAAENLFLRKQLGLYIERQKKPRRATSRIRFTLTQLAKLFEWRDALTVVKPDTLIRWHRKGFPSVLEMEVSVGWPTESSSQRPEVDHRDG